MQTEMSGKYNSPFFFLYFFYHFSSRKDQFTVLILKFNFEDFIDHLSGPTKDPAVPHWFVVVVLPSQEFLWTPGTYSHTLLIRVCAAQRGRDFEAPDLERGIHFRGVF